MAGNYEEQYIGSFNIGASDADTYTGPYNIEIRVYMEVGNTNSDVNGPAGNSNNDIFYDYNFIFRDRNDDYISPILDEGSGTITGGLPAFIDPNDVAKQLNSLYNSRWKQEVYVVDLVSPTTASFTNLNFMLQSQFVYDATDGAFTSRDFNIIQPITTTRTTGSNGTATIYMDRDFTYEYSLDGLTWQSSNSFTGLSAGFYTVYVRLEGDTFEKQADFEIKTVASTAYNVIYRGTFININSNEFQVDILKKDYVGGITTITMADDPVAIRYYGDEENKYNPVKPSECIIRFISNSSFNYVDLYSEGMYDYILKVYKDSALYWQGLLNPSNYIEPLRPAPFPVEMSFFDGLGALKDIDFKDLINDNLIGNVSLFNIMLNCLDSINSEFDIYTNVNIYNDAMDDTEATDDPMKQAFVDVTTYNGLDCYTVLSDILNIFNARIVQCGGAWYVLRFNNMVGDFTLRKYDYEGTYQSQSTENTILELTGSGDADLIRFSNNNQNLTLIQAIKDLTATRTFSLKEDLSQANQIEKEDIIRYDNGNWGLTGFNSLQSRYGGFKEGWQFDEYVPDIDGKYAVRFRMNKITAMPDYRSTVPIVSDPIELTGGNDFKMAVKIEYYVSGSGTTTMYLPYMIIKGEKYLDDDYEWQDVTTGTKYTHNPSVGTRIGPAIQFIKSEASDINKWEEFETEQFALSSGTDNFYIVLFEPFSTNNGDDLYIRSVKINTYSIETDEDIAGNEFEIIEDPIEEDTIVFKNNNDYNKGIEQIFYIFDINDANTSLTNSTAIYKNGLIINDAQSSANWKVAAESTYKDLLRYICEERLYNYHRSFHVYNGDLRVYDNDFNILTLVKDTNNNNKLFVLNNVTYNLKDCVWNGSFFEVISSIYDGITQADSYLKFNEIDFMLINSTDKTLIA